MSRLVLGPLLRHVDERSATIWVETERPCTVEALGHRAQTFTVHGHHYALVDVTGLEPGSDTVYDVKLDGETVWPEPESPFPPARIRTPAPGQRHRIVFGSCRQAPDEAIARGVDALSAYAHELAAGAQPPTLLLMIGDQVYADETVQWIKTFIRARRDITAPPYGELADFEEYAELYRYSWMIDPAVRWLLATVPTFMIFDDHDVRDDWNTSQAWRDEIRTKPWWRARIVGGLTAYWIYQHLGNLSPAARAADPLFTAVRSGQADAGKLLDEFAERADQEPQSAAWGYTHDLPGTRIVVTDSRCRRDLAPGRRAMIDAGQQAWLDGECVGGVDHLVIASSLPYLLPPTIHHAENWDEAIAAGAWGNRASDFGERLRQAADLEHWAAFDRSFRSVAASVTAVARGERGPVPATVTFLGGDVHYSYVARIKGLPIYQLVCSPMRNELNGIIKWANVIACRRLTSGPARLVSRLAGTPRPPVKWRVTDGPWFENSLATIEIDGRTATVVWQTPNSPTTLRHLAQASLP